MRYSLSGIGQGACMGDGGLRQQDTGAASSHDLIAAAPGRGGALAGRVKVAMAVHRWDDEEILRALRHAFRARQAVPRVFVEAGRSAFGWRNVGVELAQLTYDSTRDLEPALSPRAEAASARVLTYASAHLIIELEVTPAAVAGQILPDCGSVLTVQPRAGEESLVQASETGRFTLEPVPPGPFRLHCRTAAGINVITGWITL